MKPTLRLRSAFLATFVAAVACFSAAGARADDAINVYGPGGPAPAMKEAAQAFGATNKVTVNVVAGPTPQRVEKAKTDADVVFSGAENMMSDFAKALPGAVTGRAGDLRQVGLESALTSQQKRTQNENHRRQ